MPIIIRLLLQSGYISRVYVFSLIKHVYREHLYPRKAAIPRTNGLSESLYSWIIIPAIYSISDYHFVRAQLPGTIRVEIFVQFKIVSYLENFAGSNFPSIIFVSSATHEKREIKKCSARTVTVLSFVSRCQGYSRVIKVIQFLPVYYYTVGKGSSWYKTDIAWDPPVLCNIHGNSPPGLRPRARACIFHKTLGLT